MGALAAFVGGVNVASPIIGENLMFVSLLALGCYQTGRLLFGPLAGLLAVVFVLGSPLLISQFHVFMLDAPLAALVAVSIWLILASEDFSRVGMAALAGLAVGLGLNIKVQFALFVVGLVADRRCCTAAGATGVASRSSPRSRWSSAAPWYIVHFSEFGTIARTREHRAAARRSATSRRRCRPRTSCGTSGAR